MECLNCGAPILEDGHCSACGMNYELLKKAYNTSNYYYNVGLDRASVRDLTGAIEVLNLALKYNKQNINARNLLGLVYFEMGEVVLGLMQWVISNHYLTGEYNIAGYYIKMVQQEPTELEEANQLAKQFNQALLYARQGTKDLAYLQLKRILSGYPHFVKGYLLLALLYIDSGNYDKAKKALKRVLRIDKNNTLAVKYLKEMGMSSKDIISMKELSRHVDVDAAYSEEDQFSSDLENFVKKSLDNIDKPEVGTDSYKEINHNKFNLIYVSVGLVLGIFVSLILILPTSMNKLKKENKKSMIEYSEDVSQKNLTISGLEDQIEVLEKEISNQKNEMKKERTQSKDSDFAIVKKYMPNTTYTTMCEEASKAIENEDYDQAIEMCKIALKIQEGEEVYYYMGTAYLRKGDSEKASEMFTQLKENYPESTYLDEITD